MLISHSIIPMCNAMGAGWAFTLFGFVFAMLTSVIFLLMSRGQKWRVEAAEKKKRKELVEPEAKTPDIDIESQSNIDAASTLEKNIEVPMVAEK